MDTVVIQLWLQKDALHQKEGLNWFHKVHLERKDLYGLRKDVLSFLQIMIPFRGFNFVLATSATHTWLLSEILDHTFCPHNQFFLLSFVTCLCFE